MSIDRRSVLKGLLAVPLVTSILPSHARTAILPSLYKHRPEHGWDTIVSFPSVFESKRNKKRAIAEWHWSIKCGYRPLSEVAVVPGRIIYIWMYDPNDPTKKIIEAIRS